MGIICFLSCYVLALIFEGVRVSRKSAVLGWLALGTAGLGGFVHIAYLMARSGKSGLPPLMASSHDWLLVLALITLITYLILQIWNKQFSFGPFMLPAVIMLVGASTYVQQSAVTSTETPRFWVMLHVSSLVIGFGAVLMSFILSLMYLVQHQRLKSKQLSDNGLILPNLERLATKNRYAVFVMVVFLTVGMFSGIGLVFSSGKTIDLKWQDPIVLGYSVVWLFTMGIFAWFLRSKQQLSKQVAFLSSWALGFVLVTVVGLLVLSKYTSSLTSLHG